MSGWAVELFMPYHSERIFGKDFCDRDGEEVRQWMIDHFGPIDYSKSAGTWRWTIKHERAIEDGSGLTFGDFACFRNPRDAILFKLTWL